MDPERVAMALERLSTKLDDGAIVADRFRSDMRDGFDRVERKIERAESKIEVHAADDVKRFQAADDKLDMKVSDLYTHLGAQENERHKRAWQITGVALTGVGVAITVVISLYRSGLLSP